MPHDFEERRLEIRRYRDSDRDDVWSLHRNAIEQIEALDAGDDFYADLHDIPTAYFAPGGEYLVGRVAGRMVAMGGFTRTLDDEAEIKRMRVHSDCQRRGFGRTILEALEDRAREFGIELLRLETTVRQEAANKFYRKNGYAETGRGKTLGFDVIRYEKRLRSGPPCLDPQTVTTTFPNCFPVSRYSCAARSSESGKVRSTTALRCPVAINLRTL